MDDIYLIRAEVSRWIADPTVQVVLITGGTGFNGRVSTPEAVSVLFDKTVDGFGELFRALSLEEIGTSTLQSSCSTRMRSQASRQALVLPGRPGTASWWSSWTPPTGRAISCRI